MPGPEFINVTPVHILLARTGHKVPLDMAGDGDGEPEPQLATQGCYLSHAPLPVLEILPVLLLFTAVPLPCPALCCEAVRRSFFVSAVGGWP